MCYSDNYVYDKSCMLDRLFFFFFYYLHFILEDTSKWENMISNWNGKDTIHQIKVMSDVAERIIALMIDYTLLLGRPKVVSSSGGRETSVTNAI